MKSNTFIKARANVCRRVWQILLLLAVTCPVLSSADTISSNALRELRALSKQSFQGPFDSNGYSKRAQDFAKFRRVLVGVAADDRQPGSSVEEKTFLRVARESSVRPELLDELLAKYGTPSEAAKLSRAMRPPLLDPVNITEAYRAAWEALLLAPQSEQIEFMAIPGTIAEALARIGNPKSIVVLETAFGDTCEPGAEFDSVDMRQRQIIAAFRRFPSPEALRALLNILERGEKAQPQGRLRKYFIESVIDQNDIPLRQQWGQLVKSFPRAELSGKQRALLDIAREH